MGPGSPAVLLVVGRVRWGRGWPYSMAAPCGSSAEGQGDWGLVRQWIRGLRQLLGACAVLYVKGNSDPAVVSVVLLGVLICESRSWRSVHSRHFSCLPSWWSHVEIGHHVHEPLVPGSSFSQSGFTLHGAMLGSTVGTCYASAPGVFGRFSL